MMAIRSRWKSLTLFRGLMIFAPLFIIETIVAVLSIWALPPGLSLVPQIIIPLPLAQLYCLWTHTILTYPAKEAIWRRIPPFASTLRATGPALAAFLLAKALQKTTLHTVASIKDLTKEGHLAPRFVGPMVLAAVLTELVVLVPTRLVLTRIQASLLPDGQRTVVAIDDVLKEGGKNGDTGAVGVLEAWRTFTWSAWARLLFLYAQIFVVVVIGGGAVLLTAFFFNILLSLIAG